jgi:hypothetical protein
MFLLGVFVLPFSGLLRAQTRYGRNYSEPFHGLIFKDPYLISNFYVERNIEDMSDIIEHTCSFNYLGEDNLEVFILGKEIDNIITKHNINIEDTVQIAVDNSAEITQEIVNISKLKPIYDEISNFDYTGVSFKKLSAPEDEAYTIKIRLPMRKIFDRNKVIIRLSTFITNAKIDNILDDEKSINLNVGEYYISSIEIYNKNLIFNHILGKYIRVICIIIFIVYVFKVIFGTKRKSSLLVLISLYYIFLNFYKVMGKELSGGMGFIIIFSIFGLILSSILAYKFS